MPNPGSALDQIEIRLAEWILYLLRGGKPDVLRRILASEFYPRDQSHELLRSILTDNESGFRAALRQEDRDLLIGARTGYALSLDPKNAEDRIRMDTIVSLARSAKVDILLGRDAIIRRLGVFRDQLGRLVDVDLTVRREQFRQLVGDLLSRIAEERSGQEEQSASWPAYGAPDPLLDERSRSQLRFLLDQETPKAPDITLLPTDHGRALDSLPAQGDLALYATQLLFRDVAILLSRPQIERDSYVEQDRSDEVQRLFPAQPPQRFVALDPDQALRLVLAERRIPNILGPYDIVAVLGVGAQTVTCIAIDRTALVRRRVVLRIQITCSTDEYTYLPGETTQEILMSRAIEPILPYQRIIREDRFIILVIEYVQGGNLGEFVSNVGGSARFKMVVRAFADVCEALAHAHAHGVPHGAIALEKILFSAQRQRFMLAHFRFPHVTDRKSADVLREEFFKISVQRDLSNVGVIFSSLLGDMEAPLLAVILERCRKQGFSNAGELRQALSTFLEPEKEPLIVLTADYNAEAQTIRYHLDIGSYRCPEMISFGVNHRTISDLYMRWDRIGGLALGRADRVRDCAPVAEIDRGIRAFLEEVSDDATHFVLGPKVQGGLEKHQEATLWVRYDPRLAAVPWELLAVGGSRVCRQFHVARSPLLVARIRHPGLRIENRIRLLFIENPDGDLEGARRECWRLREEIKSSPFADRIEVETVNHDSDSLTIRSRMLRSDIIHFAGHGLFSEPYTEESGLSLGGDDILRARQLEEFWRDGTPFLVFANACGSGRVNQLTSRQRVYSDSATGLGQAFLAVGVGNYIGTMWKAPDGDTTIDFAVEFYRWFLSGCTVSRAIRAARDLCVAKYGEEDLTWARYVLFGHPLNRLEI